MAEMKAVVYRRGGPPQVLEQRMIEKPLPGSGEVLIRIHATTVTFGDAALRRMRGPMRWMFGLAFGLGRDAVLGHELAGVIDAVGEGVTRFQIGDAVFGSTGKRGGAYAEYICLPQDGMLAGKPANMSFEQAAAVPIGANTALHILRKADLQPGQKVLVNGASGSVGTYAVQLARHFGAEVTGVCSEANLELVASLGAVHVLDYAGEDFTRSGARYDVVFDAVGKLPASQARRALVDGGMALSVRSPTKEELANLLFLKDLIEAGKLRAVIDRTYPLEQIRDAHAYVEQGHKRGNVVIRVRQQSGRSV
jgi:NADPH:quinone reductase-like Zn-dependent oxidoreductase